MSWQLQSQGLQQYWCESGPCDVGNAQNPDIDMPLLLGAANGAGELGCFFGVGFRLAIE